ncbi:MAG: hypothetical protein OXH68_00385 [Gammaproteobacteria bacterium]|nr:hypothetical protein [Gammaproteobacteria bacterium]
MGSEVIQGATFVAVLAMAGFLWRVFDKRFETFAIEVNGRFDRYAAEMNDRFDKVDEKFDGVHDRLGALEGRFAGLDGRFDGLEVRFGSLEARVEGLATDHQRLSEQIAESRGEMRARFPLPPLGEP